MGLSSAWALSKASSPHGYQSTGLSLCCNRYGLVSCASWFVMISFSPPRWRLCYRFYEPYHRASFSVSARRFFGLFFALLLPEFIRDQTPPRSPPPFRAFLRTLVHRPPISPSSSVRGGV